MGCSSKRDHKLSLFIASFPPAIFLILLSFFVLVGVDSNRVRWITFASECSSCTKPSTNEWFCGIEEEIRDFRKRIVSWFAETSQDILISDQPLDLCLSMLNIAPIKYSCNLFSIIGPWKPWAVVSLSEQPWQRDWTSSVQSCARHVLLCGL